MTNDKETIRRLRDALKPFADAAEDLDELHVPNSPIWESPAAMSIEARHLRIARFVWDETHPESPMVVVSTTDVDNNGDHIEMEISVSMWENYRGDFDSMTDEEIERECNTEQDKLDETESWLEAVAAWKASGSPRRDK